MKEIQSNGKNIKKGFVSESANPIIILGIQIYAQPALAADGQGAKCESRNADLRFRIEMNIVAGGPQLKRHRWALHKEQNRFLRLTAYANK